MQFSDFTNKISYQQNQNSHPAHANQPIQQKKKRGKGRIFNKPLPIVIAVVVCLALVFFIYGYYSTRNQLMHLKSANSSSQSNETQQLIDKVGNLVQLPANEPPTIATVSNASHLKSQQFFSRAKDGDKLLIYSKSGLGVLYRPSTNKIIAYSPVNLNNK
jgi:cell division protein FtsL